jgi:glutamate N-acetyltransferase / amino-acid N-acetyltransferase
MKTLGIEHIEKVEKGTILSAKGFKAGGIHAGLRYAKKDFGMIYSEKPASCGAVYTQSHFQAPPLKVTQDSISQQQMLQAIVVNSAVANACTGEQGLKDAYKTRHLIADRFQIPEEFIAVASTGVIGEWLPMDKIEKGCSEVMVESNEESAQSFQQAILTTDTVEKSACYQLEVEGETVTIGGAAKGSGMIHPNMATMLGFITTDATIASEKLQVALSEAINQSFNQITVDGETSTNDMVLVMANGMVEHQTLDEKHPDWKTFKKGLQLVCEDLAKQIARDGEGATKLVEVEVVDAYTDDEARVIAKKVVGSDLVKTAVYGADANWGRIIGAIGHSDATVNPETCDIYIGETLVFHQGTPQAFSEEIVSSYMKGEKVDIKIALHIGTGAGKAWGCDLTYDYVKINASYRT